MQNETKLHEYPAGNGAGSGQRGAGLCGEVFTFEAAPESGSRAEEQSAPVWEAPETERQEPDGHEWTPPEPECVDLDAYAQEVLTLANARREAAGLNPLSANPVLTEMAMLRARELEESYSHTRPSGENCKTVFGEFETDLRFWGENAAKGNRTPEAVVEAWMDSPGHRENLLRGGRRIPGRRRLAG